ncbi:MULTISPECIES: DUF982 domain-containing protein [unclassified Mesorhizobium]|uniref:DUF982 domain-containing protein n=1 Tax=unclassified Mesorhizobium TaxID=325217 RepID=UPI0011269272|nr:MULTISPECIES: DUF982 domain-containing protein [unclassified Mesorhizobium]TPI57422.1 DUF982 domain-containing protein [Mesorhizobium sp. B3-1-7]TPJ37119.1 DUF982 domain-containing protein [Mesorhizobium sp. B2-8-3]
MGSELSHSLDCASNQYTYTCGGEDERRDAFARPVLVDDEFLGARSICCAMDAIEFLEEWPIEQRGSLHSRASDCCCAAYDGHSPADLARQMFVAWAQEVGVAVGLSFDAKAGTNTGETGQR